MADRVRTHVMRQFLSTLVFVGAVAGLACHQLGEDLTVRFADFPVTDRGWPVLGWFFAGPPVVLFALLWNDRRRFGTEQLRDRALFYGAWAGLGCFALPALVDDSAALFGRGVEIGNPIAFGWACGAVANLAALVFAVAIDRLAAQGDARARRIALRFIETAWVLLVAGSLLFAAYGRELGFNY